MTGSIQEEALTAHLGRKQLSAPFPNLHVKGQWTVLPAQVGKKSRRKTIKRTGTVEPAVLVVPQNVGKCHAPIPSAVYLPGKTATC